MKPPIIDPEEKERRKLLLDQQAQIVALRNTIQDKRRRLDEAFHYNEIRQLEDEKINLGKQLLKLNQELEDARRDDNKQLEMVETLDNGVFSKQNEKKLKQNLLSAKLESKMMSEQRADIERELNEKHILKISGQRELRDLKAKIAEATSKRNKDAENPPPDLSEEAFDAIRQQIKDINYKKDVLNVDFEEEMLNLELLLLELKKEKSQLEASLKEKKWNSRHNQVKIKELQRMVRFREAIGTKTVAREVLYTNRDEDVEYFVEKAELIGLNEEENHTFKGNPLGNSNELDTVFSKDESKAIPKLTGMTMNGSKGTDPQDSGIPKPKQLPKLEPISGVSGINGKSGIKLGQGSNPGAEVRPPATNNQKSALSEVDQQGKLDNRVNNMKNIDGKDGVMSSKDKFSTVNDASKQSQGGNSVPHQINATKNITSDDKQPLSKENTYDNTKVVDSSIRIIEKPSEKGKENFESKLENKDAKNYPNKQSTIQDSKPSLTKPDPNNKTEIKSSEIKSDQKPNEIPKANLNKGQENGAEKELKPQGDSKPKDTTITDQDTKKTPAAIPKINTNDQNTTAKTEVKPTPDAQIQPGLDQKGQDSSQKMISKTPTFTDPTKLPGTVGKTLEEKEY
jgi:hypothetical protein